MHCNGFFHFVVRRHRLNGNGYTIKFAGKTLFYTRYGPQEWFVNMFLQDILTPMSTKKA